MEKRNIKKNKLIPHLLAFMWVLFFTFSSLMALDPQKTVTQYKQDTWQMERGLEQKTVVSICQTHDGYIWLGTLDGLVRFDGISFKTFNKENTKGLQNNMITTLLEDQKGNLWIGSVGGGLSYLKNGEIKSFPADYPGLKEIYTIFPDRAGTLWISTINKGLFHLKNGEMTSYNTGNGLASSEVHAFYQDENGQLWIGTSAGLYIFKPGKGPGKFTTYEGTNGPFVEYIYSLLGTKSGELWIGCTTGLFHLKDNTISQVGKDRLARPMINCLYEDSDRNLWAGTDGSGLIRVKNNKLETFPPGHGLVSSEIYAICEDREKNLWIGTAKEGLHRLRDTLFVPYTTWQGLSNNLVNCIYEDREGSLWIGTSQGVNLLEDGKLTLKWTTKNGLLSNIITAILEDSQGSLWIGTKKGLNRYKDGKIQRIDHYTTIHDRDIKQLGEDDRGAVWILTEKRLTRFYKEIFTDLINEKKESNHLLRCFYFDREGCLWLGTYGGKGVYRRKNSNLNQYTTKDGLVHNNVEYFYEDKEGVLYIGTRGGLSLRINENFINITTRQGLIDDFIYFILEDELDHLWLAGRTGISRISKKELLEYERGEIKKVKPVLFNESEGMLSPICNDCIKTRDGKLWIASDKGFAMIDPAKIKENPQPPLVVIEELIADGVPTHIGSLQLRCREDTPLEISPGIERLEFKYTGLSFVESRKIKFKVKLEGYDKNWREMGNVRSTDYTNLSPGIYTFKAKAGNSDGVWNEQGAVFSFYLKPYFYQTFWFYFFSALFIIAGGFAAYRFRISQLKHKQQELAALVEMRTRELEDKNLQLEEQSEKLKEMDKIKSRFFANISHEFRTPITLLMGPLEKLIADCRDNDTERKRKLTMMLRNAQRLLRLINQLLELSRLDSGKMKMHAVKTDVVSFVKGIADSFRFLVQQKEMELVFRAEQEDKTETGEIPLYFDPRKMEDIISNLLINAVKFTRAGGEIRVSVKGLKEFVEISVSDTGPGIPPDQLAHVFERFYQADATYEHYQRGSGIGLALSKELVELHHGTIEARSKEGEGTTFIVRLPIEKDHLAEDEIAGPGAPVDIKNHVPQSKILEETPALEIVMEEKEIEPETGTNKKDIILLVEDSADMRYYIKEALEPDYTAAEAEDGREGIEKAQDIIPDLIVSDIMMPEVNGYELCRELKNDVKTSHIPIILLTAKASEENIVEGLEMGADDYITKPFSTRILSARIKNLIDIRKQLQININREMTLQPVKTSVSKIDKEFIRDVHSVINKNLCDPEFNVEDLCKRLYMSRTTLYRKVQALSGLTPTDFIRTYRLKRGAELLKQSTCTVLEVAFEVGFSNSSYFAKCFKEKFHQLPSEYQEANRK